MSELEEYYFAVLLYGDRIGTLCQRGDYTQFWFNDSYLDDPDRPILGLRFEESLRGRYAKSLRLPQWFSNLLPEGPLREWVAQARGVSLDREMELLAQVGHDLPGAVQVVRTEYPDGELHWPDTNDAESGKPTSDSGPWRFSLAGVALKFSMLQDGDRLTVPTAHERGDWLVKFPDYRHKDVPRNEFAIMSLAKAVGIDTPETRMLHRDQLPGLPSRMWPNEEEWAYAVRRFDRSSKRGLIHAEDFAQVRDKYPHQKYEGTFETVAALSYRGHDERALVEAIRRISFNVVIGNGDAHLKNWTLLYQDRHRPTLSPAYDLVATTPYVPFDSEGEDLGLKLDGSRRFESVTLNSFERLERRLRTRFGAIDADLAAVAAATAEQTRTQWPDHQDILVDNPELLSWITSWIDRTTNAVLGRVSRS
nr:HipA domain-containing protein [Glycomyces salinus]